MFGAQRVLQRQEHVESNISTEGAVFTISGPELPFRPFGAAGQYVCSLLITNTR